MLRTINNPDTKCFIAGPVAHKVFTVSKMQSPMCSGFNCGLTFKTRGHHAGLRFYVELPGKIFELEVYDHRHWDFDNGCWKSHDETV